MVVQDSLTVNWDVESFLQTIDDDLFQKLPAVLEEIEKALVRWEIAEDVVCCILGDSSITWAVMFATLLLTLLKTL